ncbi:MAG TPA: hypothetical protein VF933_18135, partial [Streptosporangiaceae bacterium]
MGLKNAVLVMMVAALAVAGCQTLTEEVPSQPTPIAAPSAAPVTLPAQAPAPSPVPSPVPTPAPPPVPPTPPSPGSIDSIRVAFFGINCGKGNPVPNNGWKLLPKGCRGYVTATPKRKDNTDVPAKEHGPDIDWFM